MRKKNIKNYSKTYREYPIYKFKGTTQLTRKHVLSRDCSDCNNKIPLIDLFKIYYKYPKMMEYIIISYQKKFMNSRQRFFFITGDK